MENIENAAEKWYEGMSKEEWIEMEKKHGYYGHDIGTTKEDIVNIYKSEFSTKITKQSPKNDLSWMWHCSSTPDNVLDYSHLTDVSDKITPALTKAAAHGFRLAMRRMEELGLIDMNDIDRKPNEIDQKTWDEKFKKESDED